MGCGGCSGSVTNIARTRGGNYYSGGPAGGVAIVDASVNGNGGAIPVTPCKCGRVPWWWIVVAVLLTLWLFRRA